jgi:7-carboxy-7-deazaguanine synthase
MLRLNELHACILGESLLAGLPASLIRLAGCNLRCKYCDSSYSYEESGEMTSVESIVERVQTDGFRRALITGGEPMLQPDEAVHLMDRLLQSEIEVMLETNGTLPLGRVPAAVIKVVDVKTPGALTESAPLEMIVGNLAWLNPEDQLKFVITDRDDYLWALEFLKAHPIELAPGSILFSPAWGSLEPATLADWMLEDKTPWRFQLQLHKAVWGDIRGV